MTIYPTVIQSRSSIADALDPIMKAYFMKLQRRWEQEERNRALSVNLLTSLASGSIDPYFFATPAGQALFQALDMHKIPGAQTIQQEAGDLARREFVGHYGEEAEPLFPPTPLSRDKSLGANPPAAVHMPGQTPYDFGLTAEQVERLRRDKGLADKERELRQQYRVALDAGVDEIKKMRELVPSNVELAAKAASIADAMRSLGIEIPAHSISVSVDKYGFPAINFGALRVDDGNASLLTKFFGAMINAKKNKEATLTARGAGILNRLLHGDIYRSEQLRELGVPDEAIPTVLALGKNIKEGKVSDVLMSSLLIKDNINSIIKGQNEQLKVLAEKANVKLSDNPNDPISLLSEVTLADLWGLPSDDDVLRAMFFKVSNTDYLAGPDSSVKTLFRNKASAPYILHGLTAVPEVLNTFSNAEAMYQYNGMVSALGPLAVKKYGLDQKEFYDAIYKKYRQLLYSIPKEVWGKYFGISEGDLISLQADAIASTVAKTALERASGMGIILNPNRDDRKKYVMRGLAND